MNLSQPITPFERHEGLAKEIGLEELYFKREDLHPLGSHKGRSIAYMIDHYLRLGDRNFVISSSGNAAIAAATYIRKLNSHITLDIFVGQKINREKLAILKELSNENIRVLLKERPLQALFAAVAEENKRSLRQSVDDIALLGYESLATEIIQEKGVSAVFVATSSGTTAQALAQYFEDNKANIQVHIVQTSSCHPMSEEFDLYSGGEEVSEADAIVDIVTRRKNTVTELVKQTGGFGWIARNDEIHLAMNMTRKITGIEISPNSALSLVGAMKASYEGYDIGKKVVCIISGR